MSAKATIYKQSKAKGTHASAIRSVSNKLAKARSDEVSKNSETQDDKDAQNLVDTLISNELNKDGDSSFKGRLTHEVSKLAFRRAANTARSPVASGSGGASSGAAADFSLASSSNSWGSLGAAKSSLLGDGGIGDGNGGDFGGGGAGTSGNVTSEGIKEVASSAEKAAANAGKEKGDDISDGGHFTAYNSTDAFHVSWMNGNGNFGSQDLRRQVEGGMTLGEALLAANGKRLGRQSLVTAGESVSKDVGTDANRVKGVVGIIDSTHRAHGNWFLHGDYANAIAIGKEGGLKADDPQYHSNNPDKFRAALREAALKNAKEGGGGTLIVTSAAHGNSRKGHDNKSSISGFSVGGQWYSETQYEADIAAAKVLGGYDNVVAINNPCFCGGMDGIDDTGKVDDIARIA